MFGTASRVTNWLLLEQAGPWGYDVTVDTGLPADVATGLVPRLRELGIRLVLIRNRDRRRPRRRHVYLVHSGTTGCFIERGQIHAPAELLEVDLCRLPRGLHVGMGSVKTEPIYLVCTHGRHDVCCSIRGWPLAKLLGNRLPGRVWECSHIGGDRFAGNLVCLPEGIYYGRLGPDDALGAVASHERGTIDLDHYRGRSCYPTVIQAAEHFVRRIEGIAGIDDLVMQVSHRLSPTTAGVRFARSDGRSVEAIIRVKRDEVPVLLTCRAKRPSRPPRFELVSISRAGA